MRSPISSPWSSWRKWEAFSILSGAVRLRRSASARPVAIGMIGSESAHRHSDGSRRAATPSAAAEPAAPGGLSLGHDRRAVGGAGACQLERHAVGRVDLVEIVDLPGEPAGGETVLDLLGVEPVRRRQQPVAAAGCRLDPVAARAERLHVLPDLGPPAIRTEGPEPVQLLAAGAPIVAVRPQPEAPSTRRRHAAPALPARSG